MKRTDWIKRASGLFVPPTLRWSPGYPCCCGGGATLYTCGAEELTLTLSSTLNEDLNDTWIVGPGGPMGSVYHDLPDCTGPACSWRGSPSVIAVFIGQCPTRRFITVTVNWSLNPWINWFLQEDTDEPYTVDDLVDLEIPWYEAASTEHDGSPAILNA